MIFYFYFLIQVESLGKDGTVDAPTQHPFFALTEDTEPASKKVRVEERAPTGDDLVVVAMEFTIRGACALWPHLLQCDTLSRYRLRGPLQKRLIDCYGDTLYTVLV